MDTRTTEERLEAVIAEINVQTRAAEKLGVRQQYYAGKAAGLRDALAMLKLAGLLATGDWQ